MVAFPVPSFEQREIERRGIVRDDQNPPSRFEQLPDALEQCRWIVDVLDSGNQQDHVITGLPQRHFIQPPCTRMLFLFAASTARSLESTPSRCQPGSPKSRSSAR